MSVDVAIESVANGKERTPLHGIVRQDNREGVILFVTTGRVTTGKAQL